MTCGQSQPERVTEDLSKEAQNHMARIGTSDPDVLLPFSEFVRPENSGMGSGSKMRATGRI